MHSLFTHSLYTNSHHNECRANRPKVYKPIANILQIISNEIDSCISEFTKFLWIHNEMWVTIHFLRTIIYVLLIWIWNACDKFRFLLIFLSEKEQYIEVQTCDNRSADTCTSFDVYRNNKLAGSVSLAKYTQKLLIFIFACVSLKDLFT